MEQVDNNRADPCENGSAVRERCKYLGQKRVEVRKNTGRDVCRDCDNRHVPESLGVALKIELFSCGCLAVDIHCSHIDNACEKYRHSDYGLCIGHTLLLMHKECGWRIII